MKTFALPAACRLKLTKATPRKESHGKDLVQAISLRLEWWPTENSALNLLHEGLQDMVFWTPPEVAAQCDLDGIPPIKKHLRCPTVARPWKVEAAFTGYTFTIDHGIDESTALELYACSLDKFEADAKEGGSAIIRWSLASNKQITPQLVGALCALEGAEIVATLTPPAEGTTEATGAEIDGTKGHPGADAGQGSLLDDQAQTPVGALAASLEAGAEDGSEDDETRADAGESAGAEDGAAEQAELEAGMRSSMNAAGVKPKRGAAKVH